MKKRRTHVVEVSDEEKKAPRSIIMRRGVVAEPVSRLIENLRQVMEPYTARRLKERTKTRLKDVLSIAGVLHVTHIVSLSQSVFGTAMRIIRVPRGPTITFQVMAYSLCSDVRQMQNRPVCVEPHLKHAPLVVLNNLSSQPIVAAMLQNMFPTINVSTVQLSTCRRIVLFSYDEEDDVIHFRHFLINASPTGVSKSVRMLVKSKVPDLHKYADISEVLLGGVAGASDSEAEDVDESRVTLAQDFVGRGNRRSQRSAIRLSEVGPRMTLQVRKIEDGVAAGEVIYNRDVKKTEEEIATLTSQHEQKMALKEHRRKEQERNVQKKKQLEEEKKNRKRKRTAAKIEKDAESDSEDKDAEVDTDDDEWYRRDVGEEPEHFIGCPKQKKKGGKRNHK